LALAVDAKHKMIVDVPGSDGMTIGGGKTHRPGWLRSGFWHLALADLTLANQAVCCLQLLYQMQLMRFNAAVVPQLCRSYRKDLRQIRNPVHLEPPLLYAVANNHCVADPTALSS
jgi:hypothetical protein